MVGLVGWRVGWEGGDEWRQPVLLHLGRSCSSLPIHPCPHSCSGVMCRWASKHGAGPEAADTGATAGPADAPPTHPLPVLLPLLPQAEAANPVPACMWNDLKRRRYDFGRANGVLAGLGLPLGPDAKKNKARAALARENAAGAGGAPAGAPAVPGPVGEAEAAAEAAAPKPEPASPAPTAPAHAPEPAPSPSPEPLPAPVPPPSCDYVEARLHARERIPLDLRDKLYLAPLTTVGNLPFRALCVGLGADVTCGEMALATTLLQGAKSEWALARRHVSERCFGVQARKVLGRGCLRVGAGGSTEGRAGAPLAARGPRAPSPTHRRARQICGGYPDAMAHAAQALTDACPALDFIDINLGCPIDCVCGRGAGAALLTKPGRVEAVCRAVAGVSDVPLTIKARVDRGLARVDSGFGVGGRVGRRAPCAGTRRTIGRRSLAHAHPLSCSPTTPIPGPQGVQGRGGRGAHMGAQGGPVGRERGHRARPVEAAEVRRMDEDWARACRRCPPFPPPAAI